MKRLLLPAWLVSARWWAQRSPREQLLLAVAAAAIVLYAGVAGGVRPILAARAGAAADIARYDADLARLAAAPPGDPQAQAQRPVTAVLTETAPQFSLDIQMIEAEGDGVRVELGDAAFADVMRWIDQLHRSYSLRSVSVEMDRRADPGVVGTRLTVVR